MNTLEIEKATKTESITTRGMKILGVTLIKPTRKKILLSLPILAVAWIIIFALAVGGVLDMRSAASLSMGFAVGIVLSDCGCSYRDNGIRGLFFFLFLASVLLIPAQGLLYLIPL